jgi:hypothetical protein
MKRYLYASAILSAILLIASYSNAQIPNGDFEEWSNELPVGWITNWAPISQTISMSTSAYDSSYALQGQVVGIPSITPPTGETGQFGNAEPILGFPYAFQPVGFSGYYQFSPAGNDMFVIGARFKRNGVWTDTAQFVTSSGTQGWKVFHVLINWKSSTLPDSADVYFQITNPGGDKACHLGSQFLLDALRFDTTLANVYETPSKDFDLAQNSPNPFGSVTKITYTLPEGGYVSLQVYDVTGRLIRNVLQTQQSAGLHEQLFNADGLPSGVYFYRLTSGQYSMGRWMQILH